MKRGRKPDTPAQHAARGTVQPSRHSGHVEILAAGSVIEPGSLPARPDNLSEDALAVWLDNIGRVSSTRMATELDTDMFANYCRLQGAINSCWRSGEVPPAAHLMEARKMQEMFGIAGAKSRVGKLPEAPKANPFLRNGKR